MRADEEWNPRAMEEIMEVISTRSASWTLSILLFFGSIINGGTLGETDTNSSDLVVSATRVAKSPWVEPLNPTVISAAEIRQNHYRSVKEALEKQGGIYFSSFSENPALSRVNIRGFGGDAPQNKVLIMRDGHRINRPDQAAIDWSRIPLGNLERIEIMRGPASALYGDNAVGGVINIISRAESEYSAELGLEFGSYQFKRGDLRISGKDASQKLAYAVSAEHQSSGGYRDNSRYDTRSAVINLDWELGPDKSSWLNFNFGRSQYQLPGALSKLQMEADRRQCQPGHSGDDVATRSYSLGLGFQSAFAEKSELKFDFGWNRDEQKSDIPAWGTFSSTDIDRFSWQPQYILKNSLFELDNEFILGTDIEKTRLETTRFKSDLRNLKTSLAEIDKNSFGFYLRDSLCLRDNLILSAGARRERCRMGVSETSFGATILDDDVTHRESAAHLGLTYLPSQCWKFFTKIDRFYRYPSTDEQASYYGWFGSDSFNKNLNPESGWSYELGSSWRLGEQLNLKGTLFCMNLKDEIAFVGSKNVNYERTRHQGLELEGSWKPLNWVSMRLFYTALDAKFVQGPFAGREIPLVPQNKLDLQVNCQITSNLSIALHSAYVDNQWLAGDRANSGPGLAAYNLVDLQLGYESEIWGHALDIFFGIDNLFDRKYVTYASDYGFGASYYPAPGRTFRVGMKMLF